MKNSDKKNIYKKHLGITEASTWVRRFASLVPKNGPSGGRILDLAAGNGRHTRYFRTLGYSVTAIDKEVSSLTKLNDSKEVQVIMADLENKDQEGSVFINSPRKKGALYGKTFAGVVVINYLHRPLMKHLIGALEPGGVLIYETFARGNEDFARPRNPDHLLKSGELLELTFDQLQVIAYEHGIFKTAEIVGVKQRLCAINDLKNSTRKDGDPPPHTFTLPFKGGI
jgi:SAM-dependent methyltransferase